MVWAAPSSSLIREIASHGGPFHRFVPSPVARALERRYPQHYGGGEQA